MQIECPKFLDSPYYDEKTRKLKKGAPKKLVDEYNRFQKALQMSDEMYGKEPLAVQLKAKHRKLKEEKK